MGAILLLEAGGQRQIADANPVRGFLSTSSAVLHFGLGTATVAEKLHIQWPDGKVQTLENVAANQRQRLKYADAKTGTSILKLLAPAGKPNFADLSQSVGLNYRHDELGEDVQNGFADIQKIGAVQHPLARERGTAVRLCRRPNGSLPAFWAARVGEVKAVLLE